MNCKKCGNLIESTDSFCKMCGEPVEFNNAQNLNVQANNSVIQPEQQPNTFQNNIMNNPTPAAAIQPESTNNNLNQASIVMPNPVSQPTIETLNTTIAPTPMDNQIEQPAHVTPVNIEQQQMPTNLQPQNTEPVANQNISVTNNTPNPTNNKNNNFKIIVIVLVLIVVALGGFIAFKMFSKENPTNQNNNETSNDTNTINTNEQISNNSGNTYEYKNFQLTLPDSYTAKEENNLLELISQTDKVAANLYIHDYITIDDVNEEIDEIKASLITNGYTVGNIENKKYDGIDWILIHCSQIYEGKKIDVVETYASLGSYHVMEAFVGNFGTKNNDEIFTNFSKMYNSATYKGTSQFSANEEKGTANVEIKNPKFDTSIIE